MQNYSRRSANKQTPRNIPHMIKRGLYVVLFLLLGLELLNVYSQYFTPQTQQVIPSIPLKTEKPAQASRDVLSQNQTTQVTPIPTGQWGKATQIDEHTWTIKVGEDKHMATPDEILIALNNYRQVHGSGTLQKDDKLTQYAQSRADLFNSMNSTDKHAGFTDFVNNQNGFDKLGFNALGENSSLGFHVEGVHLIEWVYAGDADHDRNQLNPSWTHVGIGVNNTGTDLIFGGNKQ